MIELIRKIVKTEIAKLERRIANSVARGEVYRVNDTPKLQEHQVGLLADELHELERMQQYGFTSVPLAGSECFVSFIGGNRDHGLIISVDDRRNRKTGLDDGDVSVYNAAGAFIRLYNDNGKIVIEAPENIIIKATDVARIEADSIELHATTSIKWDVAGRGYTYYPTHTDAWENGTAVVPISVPLPPEHPPAAAA